jgi:hypothetical protein
MVSPQTQPPIHIKAGIREAMELVRPRTAIYRPVPAAFSQISAFELATPSFAGVALPQTDLHAVCGQSVACDQLGLVQDRLLETLLEEAWQWHGAPEVRAITADSDQPKKPIRPRLVGKSIAPEGPSKDYLEMLEFIQG